MREQETKPLSEAQTNHLAELIAIRNQAQAELQRFMAYLYAEHEIDPADGWDTIDPQRGFVRAVPEETPGT